MAADFDRGVELARPLRVHVIGVIVGRTSGQRAEVSGIDQTGQTDRASPSGVGGRAIRFAVAGKGKLTFMAPFGALKDDAANVVRIFGSGDPVSNHFRDRHPPLEGFAPGLEIDRLGQATVGGRQSLEFVFNRVVEIILMICKLNTGEPTGLSSSLGQRPNEHYALQNYYKSTRRNSRLKSKWDGII